MKTSMLVAGAACALAAAAVAKPPLQVLERGIQVQPKRIAKVQIVDGRAQIGDWVEVGGFGNRADEQCIWECYGRNWGAGSTGLPVGGPDCGIGEGSRWFFGTTQYQPYGEDDVIGASDAGLTMINTGWSWYIDGSGVTTAPYLAFFLWNDVSASDTFNCVGGNALGTLGGVVADFGALADGGGFYYYTEIDVSSLAITFPGSTITANVFVHADSVDTDGVITLANVPSVQTMLWGTPADTATGYIPPAGAVGSQTEAIMPDDTPGDGTIDPATECFTYAFGICPDPLGFMVAYGKSGCLATSVCPADFNGDGFVTGDDFDAYVAEFEAGNPPADFNCDGFVTGDDFDAYVAAFEAGC